MPAKTTRGVEELKKLGLLVAATAIIVAVARGDGQDQENRVLIYDAIVKPLSDFHAGAREIKTSGTLKELENQLHQFKGLIQKQRAKLGEARLKYKIVPHADAVNFEVVVESAVQYLNGFTGLATAAIQGKALSARADVLLGNLDQLEKQYDLFHASLLDKSVIDQAVQRAAELVHNYSEAKDPLDQREARKAVASLGKLLNRLDKSGYWGENVGTATDQIFETKGSRKDALAVIKKMAPSLYTFSHDNPTEYRRRNDRYILIGRGDQVYARTGPVVLNWGDHNDRPGCRQVARLIKAIPDNLSGGNMDSRAGFKVTLKIIQMKGRTLLRKGQMEFFPYLIHAPKGWQLSAITF